MSDIEAAHAELVDRGVDVSELFHDVGGVFHHAGQEGRLSGPDPARRSYASFASFYDPDGSGWGARAGLDVLAMAAILLGLGILQSGRRSLGQD